MLDNGDRQHLRDFGLSTARFNILLHLAEHTELSTTDLRILMLCDKANITRLLNRMDKDGLVERKLDISDGRRVLIRMSSLGEQVWRQAYQAHMEFTALRFESLSPEDRETLLNYLHNLESTLQRRLESAQF